MNKITIVTAFFPTNRGDWNKYSRSNQKYLDYFRFWARIQNDLIVYTDAATGAEIKKIREGFGRYNTKIIVVEDFRKIDVDLYGGIQKVADCRLSCKFRLQPENPEAWNADYNYVVMLKKWCVKDAVNHHQVSGMIAWIDFGFNHGGEYYTDSEEFDFFWEYDFSNKIHLFCIHKLEPQIPIFEVCRRMDTYIEGNIIVAPAFLWQQLWEMERSAMKALNQCGLMDDDQTTLLMAYYAQPNLFELHQSTWFSAIKDCGGAHMTVQQHINARKRPSKLKHQLKRLLMVAKYSWKWFTILRKAAEKA